MVNVKGDRINVLEHPFFLDAPDFPSLRPLLSLYLVRNYQLWKVPEVLEWLKETVKSVLLRAVEGDPMVGNCQTMVVEAYKEITEDYQRHFLLSEISEVIDTLPPHMARSGLEIYDRADVPHNPDQPLSIPNPIGLFFRSLLPWGDAPQPPHLQQNQPVSPEWLTGLLNQLGLGGGNGGEGGDVGL